MQKKYRRQKSQWVQRTYKIAFYEFCCFDKTTFVDPFWLVKKFGINTQYNMAAIQSTFKWLKMESVYEITIFGLKMMGVLEKMCLKFLLREVCDFCS